MADIRQKIRRAKISPIAKDDLRTKFLKKCLNQTKMERQQYITRIRNGSITASEIGRDIATSISEFERVKEFVMTDGDNENESAHSMFADDEYLSPDEFERLMSDIFESIQREIEDELESIMPDIDDSINNELYEVSEIPMDQMLLCVFCKNYPMDASFESCLASCRCGGYFSFSDHRECISTIEDLKAVLFDVHERQSLACFARDGSSATVNTGTLLEFQLDLTGNLVPQCQECGF